MRVNAVSRGFIVTEMTNASNGTYQIPPIHHEWNKDTAPMVASPYQPVQPRPDWYQALEAGIPGSHFEPPADAEG